MTCNNCGAEYEPVDNDYGYCGIYHGENSDIDQPTPDRLL